MAKTIGITGGIGSGKSTAARLLERLGAYVIDADRVGHEVYAPGTEGWQRVFDAFGPTIVAADGTVDRARLGALVFGDADKLALLNRIVHPLIAEAVRRRIADKRAAGCRGPIVVEAAVLIEANWQTLVDEVWVVVASPATVVDRVAAQRGLPPAAITARMQAQIRDEDRRRHADVVIENNGSLDALRARLEQLWQDRLVEAAGS